MNIKSSTIALLATLLVVSCAGLRLGPLETANHYEEFAGLRLAPRVSAAACGSSLGRDTSSRDEIAGSDIVVLNWNIKKGEEPGWSADLARYADGKALVLLQEAALSMRLPEHLNATPFAAFSPGYVKGQDITGVVTFSDVQPLSHCRLNAVEPWLGTPKSTNVTEYALRNTDRSLVVVNMHALNFSFGLLNYRQQLNAVVEVLANFQGPVIVSGDFNTWRQGRQNALREAVTLLDLKPVDFPLDYRKTVFGRPLDHIFVRGMEVRGAEVFKVSSSDHNPMVVILTLDAESSGIQEATQ